MKRLALLSLSFALLVVGCRDTQAPTEPQVLPQPASVIGEGEEAIRDLIDLLFPGPRGLRRAANNQFDKVERALAKQGLAEAKLKMFQMVNFTLTRQDEGQLLEPAAQGVSNLIDLLYGFVGLTPPNIDPTIYDADDFVVAVVPETGDTVITKEGFAAVAIPDGAITEPIVVTIRKINQTPCLPTSLIQADGCWEYQRFPAGTFDVPVGLELCVDVGVIDDVHGQAVANRTEPHKFTPATGVVKLTVAPGGFGVACGGFQVLEDAGLEGLPAFARKVHDRLVDLLGPPSLSASAIVATTRPKKLSGATGSFTDMGGAVAVNVAINAGDGQTAPVGIPVAIAPSVVVDTGGFPIAGVTVTFSVASGGGSISSPIATTNASGIATVGSWTLGLALGANSLIATTGATGDSVTFSATGVGLPDLVVSSLTHSPSSPTTADIMTFTAVVANIGVGVAGPSTLLFILPGIDTVGAPASQFSIPALGPGDTAVVLRSTPLAALTFLNTAVADVDSVVLEANETNNVTTDTFTVAPSGGGGSPVIDGIDSPGEWVGPNMFCSSFAADLPLGGGTPAMVCFKFDATNIFVRVTFNRMSDPQSLVAMEFDRDNDGILGIDPGDDFIVVQQPPAGGFFRDEFIFTGGICSPSPGPCSQSDTVLGGRLDGLGAFGNNGVQSVYEMSHPFLGGDAFDFNRSPGQSIRIQTVVSIRDSVNGAAAVTRFPLGTAGRLIPILP